MADTTKVAEALLTALRQYQHNDGSGLLAGYDLEETQRIVAAKDAEIAHASMVADELGVIVDRLRAQLAAQQAAVPVKVCDHQWLDGGQHLLVCTSCGATEDHDQHWRDMETAPRDGSMLRLLVEFSEHSTEDSEQAPTIGANNFDNDGEDNWRFAGWCWSHDHFTEGRGTPVGWLPMLNDPVCAAPAAPQQGVVMPDLSKITDEMNAAGLKADKEFHRCAADRIDCIFDAMLKAARLNADRSAQGGE